MTGYVYQCAYCGEHVPVDQAVMYYVSVEELPDGATRVIPDTYCSTYCGEQASSVSVGRG